MVSGGFKKILCGILLWTSLGFSAVLVDRVVASVNSEPILESDLKMAMLFYETTSRKELIDKLVESVLLYQFLTGRGLQASQELIEETLQGMAKSNGTTLEVIAKELSKEGLTLQDLRRFLQRELLATQGLTAFLDKEIRISEIEIELEKLKSKDLKVVRNIELLVVEKKRQEKLQELFDPKKSLDEMGRAMGIELERLRVSKGELVEVLDREVWKARPGELVFAEDGENLYIARVLSQEELMSGKTTEEIRQELFLKKFEQRRAEIIQRLRKNGFIKIIQ